MHFPRDWGKGVKSISMRTKSRSGYKLSFVPFSLHPCDVRVSSCVRRQSVVLRVDTIRAHTPMAESSHQCVWVTTSNWLYGGEFIHTHTAPVGSIGSNQSCSSCLLPAPNSCFSGESGGGRLVLLAGFRTRCHLFFPSMRVLSQSCPCLETVHSYHSPAQRCQSVHRFFCLRRLAARAVSSGFHSDGPYRNAHVVVCV